MKIYFAGAIRGGRDDAALYNELITYLQSIGTVLTEHVGDMSLTEEGDDGPDDRSIHDRDMAWLTACDLVVAEVTLPSLGVGYEIGRACAMNKPVLSLYRPQTGKTLSAMIAGCNGIVTTPYSDIAQAKEIVRQFVGDIAARYGRDSN
jgi:2'-deoxynucleoside 5'-phosphate N-hydrolase